MNANPLFERIESRAYAIAFASVSALESLTDLLEQTAEFKMLLEVMESLDGIQRVIDRAEEVLERQFDPHYRSPWDIALMTYLLGVDHCGKDFSLPLADRYAKDRNLWWSRRLACNIRDSIKRPRVIVRDAYVIDTNVLDAPDSELQSIASGLLSIVDVEDYEVIIDLIRQSHKRLRVRLLQSMTGEAYEPTSSDTAESVFGFQAKIC